MEVSVDGTEEESGDRPVLLPTCRGHCPVAFRPTWPPGALSDVTVDDDMTNCLFGEVNGRLDSSCRQKAKVVLRFLYTKTNGQRQCLRLLWGTTNHLQELLSNAIHPAAKACLGHRFHAMPCVN